MQPLRCTPASGLARRRRRVRPHAVALIVLASVLCCVPVSFMLLPCIALLLSASTADVFHALTTDAVRRAPALSIGPSAVATLVCVVIGTPAAYFLAHREVRCRRLVDAVLNLPLVLPPVLAGVALLMVFGRRGLLGGTLSAWGTGIPFTWVAVPIARVSMGLPSLAQGARAGFESVPQALVEAAGTLGMSDTKAFLRVTVPLSWSPLVWGMILCWGRALGEFGATIMFAGNVEGKARTEPLAILTVLQADLDSAAVLAVLLLSFSCGVFVVARWALSDKGPAR